MPGGAPIRERRATKRKKKKGRRAPKEELPPRKKKAKKPKAKKKPKKPCKYGPRTAEGLCPKKPRRNPFAEEEAGDEEGIGAKVSETKVSVTRGGRKTQSTVGKEAKKIFDDAIKKATKSAVDKAFQEAKNPETRARVLQAVKQGGPYAKEVLKKLPLVGAILAGAGLIFVVSKPYIRQRLKNQYVERTLLEAKRGPGGKGITPAMEAVLRKQYADFFETMNRGV